MLKFREPFNGLSHLLGALLSVFGLKLLLDNPKAFGNKTEVMAFTVYGISLILLYLASAAYHMLPVSQKMQGALRVIDHMMIYVLIAGTYTPISLLTLGGSTGRKMLIFIWLFAIIGIVTTGIWLNAPRWMSTIIYVIMGWAVVPVIHPLLSSVGIWGFMWLLAGGVFYSIGAAIYAKKRPVLNLKVIGFHEVFHLFILAGSACHYVFMYKFVLP